MSLSSSLGTTSPTLIWKMRKLRPRRGTSFAQVILLVKRQVWGLQGPLSGCAYRKQYHCLPPGVRLGHLFF